jgi:periplasmic protein TonB
MEILKNIVRSEVRFRYKLVIELSTILSLTIMILAFKFFPNIESKKIIPEGSQELFKVEDIAQTVNENIPPPPPRPSIVIAAPEQDVLEDVEINNTEIDLSQQLSAPPPRQENKVIEKETVYFAVVEDMPQPIGGTEAIQSKIKYPEIARRAGIVGTVYVLAYLNEKGEVVKTEIVKGIGGGCDEEAARAVQETMFIPGKQRGKPVKVKVMVPVKFQLINVSINL